MKRCMMFLLSLFLGACASGTGKVSMAHVRRDAMEEGIVSVENVSWWEKNATVTYKGLEKGDGDTCYILVDGDSWELGKVALSFETVSSGERYGRILVEDIGLLNGLNEGDEVIVTVKTADVGEEKTSLLMKIKKVKQ